MAKGKHVNGILLSSEVHGLSVPPVVKPDGLQLLLHLIYSYNAVEVVHTAFKTIIQSVSFAQINTPSPNSETLKTQLIWVSCNLHPAHILAFLDFLCSCGQFLISCTFHGSGKKINHVK